MTEPKIQIRFIRDREVRDHDQNVIQTFKAGQVKEMGAASARHWLNRGLAVEVQGKGRRASNAPPPPDARPEGAELVSAIVGVIGTLDPNEDYIAAGIPAVPALEKALGFAITAAERDDAWDAWQAQQEAESGAPPAPGQLQV